MLTGTTKLIQRLANLELANKSLAKFASVDWALKKFFSLAAGIERTLYNMLLLNILLLLLEDLIEYSYLITGSATKVLNLEFLFLGFPRHSLSQTEVASCTLDRQSVAYFSSINF